ncbi:MAG TPA: IS21-like element helper ATPase IstB [Bacillota bacterium]|nr:IS21-like element helper ATPase IstB [Bacillota bacterium]
MIALERARHQLVTLGLKDAAEVLDGRLEQAAKREPPYVDFLTDLLEVELGCRRRRYLETRTRLARLPFRKTLEDFDFTAQPSIEPRQVRDLATLSLIAHAENLILLGPTGVGKTYLCCALAQQVCRQGFTARYYRVPRLLTELAIAKGDGSYPQLVRQLAKLDVLVLDDWAPAPLTATEARELLEVVEERCINRSTVVASQLPIENWHAALGDPTAADAILDRLVHTTHRLRLSGESMHRQSEPAPGNE